MRIRQSQTGPTPTLSGLYSSPTRLERHPCRHRSSRSRSCPYPPLLSTVPVTVATTSSPATDAIFDADRGAGLSGLALANALQKLAPDVSFAVYEGAARLSEIGAGIGIQPRSWAVMQAFGLEEPLLKVAGDGKRSSMHGLSLCRCVCVRTHDLACLRKLSRSSTASRTRRTRCCSTRRSCWVRCSRLSQVRSLVRPLIPSRGLSETVYSFHRADLQKVFMQNLRSPEAVQLGKRLASYSQSASGPIVLRFQDGTAATCDVLIGCDGIKSSVRGAMYTAFADAAQGAGKEDEAAALRVHIAPRFSGAVVYRSLIRKETLPEDVAARAAFTKTAMVLYCGKNRVWRCCLCVREMGDR